MDRNNRGANNDRTDKNERTDAWKASPRKDDGGQNSTQTKRDPKRQMPNGNP